MLTSLRALVPYITKFKSTYAAGMVFVVVSNALITLGPKILEHGINLIDGGATPAAVARVALLLVGVTLLGGSARFGMRQLLNSGSRRVEFDLRNDLFQQLERLSPSFYDRSPTGDLMSRSTNDLLAARMAAGPALMYMVDTAVRVSMVFPAMFAMSPRLTVLALLPMLGLPVVMITLGQKIHRRSLAIQEQFGAITTHVHEHISGLRIVRAYRQERAETEEFRQLNDEYRTRNISLAKAQGAFRPLLALLAGLGGVVVLAVGGRLVMAGTVSVGEYVAFGVYLMMLAWPLIALGWAVTLVQRADAAMGRINALFHERPAIMSPTNPAVLPRAGGRGASRWTMCGSSTPAPRTGVGCCRMSPSAWRRGSRWPSSGPPVPANRPSRSFWCGATTPTRGGSCSTASTSGPLHWGNCVRTWVWCRRRRSCSAPPSARTSCWARPTMGGSSWWPRCRSWLRHCRTSRTGSTPCSANGGSTCPVGRSSERRLPGRWRRNHRYSSSTTP
ncbi:MAG: ABC transporter ATP-binding protein [Gemmatimonadales bacterium]|nr:MAG: ABC transporter ATP-binding protein [Gemmatimonadales bacterium]